MKGKIAEANRKSVNLALQGGGAHGAFTWGVLDRLLEDERIHIEAISGTSAGAMNAVVVADGIMKDGRRGALQALTKFWHSMATVALASPIKRTPLDMVTGNWSLDYSPGYLMMDVVGRLASPHELNPLNINPLRDFIAEHVDFETVRSCDKMKLFVSATKVETGRVKVFERTEMTADMVMASACLPSMFQAVEIDGVPYWDGGFMGNPVLFPFFDACASRDVVIVQINPIIRKGTPRTARDILNRVNEITFNSSLMREFRTIDFVSRLIDEGRLDEDSYRQVLCHVISSEELAEMSASSKLNAEWEFLKHLFELGRGATSAWLDGCYKHLGEMSTVDPRNLFQ